MELWVEKSSVLIDHFQDVVGAQAIAAPLGASPSCVSIYSQIDHRHLRGNMLSDDGNEYSLENDRAG
jgi:hypothetical protein